MIVALTAAANWILWLVYTNNVGIREILVGAAAAALSTVAAVLFASKGNVRFAFRWRDVFQGVYLIWYALQGTWETMQALGKQLFTKEGAASFTGAVAYAPTSDDPLSAGRRALAVTYTTITPNFVVLGIASDQKLLLYHQIVRGKVLKMTQHLGAHP